MKNCTINFGEGLYITVPEEELYGKEGERSLSPVEVQSRILQVIINHKDKWNDIKGSIIKSLKENSAISHAITFDQIKGKEGLVPNVNFKYIQDLYPEIDFPSIDVPILLLDNLDVQSNFPVMGRVLDKKGKEIFVVKGDKKSLVKLGDYLNIREKVNKEEYLESLDKDDIRDLEELAKKEGISSKDLLLEFLNNKSELKKKSKTIINGRSAYVLLEDIGRIIREVPPKKKYKNSLLNEFNYRLTGTRDGNVKISLDELAKQLNSRFPKLFPTQKLVKDLFKKKGKEIIATLQETKKLSDNEKEFLDLLTSKLKEYTSNAKTENADLWGMTLLFNTINSLVDTDENPLPLVVAGIEKGNLLLESKFPTLNLLYGFNYDTVASFTKLETRNGFNIYTQEKELKDKTITYYYVSQFMITENSQARRFNSLEAAQEWIDTHYLTQKLKKNALLDLKEAWSYPLSSKDNKAVRTSSATTFKSSVYIPEGTVITSIDMPIDIRSTSMLQEEYYLLDKSLEDFYNYIDGLEVTESTKASIKEKINTAEKAVLFLSEVNRLLNSTTDNQTVVYNRTDDTKLVNIATSIDNAKPNYYYISSGYSTGDGDYRMHFIQTNETAITTGRKNKRTPVIQLLNSIARVMEDKFGVPVHVVGEEELKTMNIELNTVKAFIRNGEIYINKSIAKGSDAFHEYAHLFLGVMKSNPEYRQNYMEFVEKVLRTKEGQKALMLKRKKFPEVATLDLEEEVVADLYGEYMLNNLPYELSTLFKYNDDIKKIQDTIFDKKDKKKTVLEFDGSLEGIWKHFNSEISKVLSDNIGFIKDGALQVQRKKANWIDEQISEGKIREECD